MIIKKLTIMLFTLFVCVFLFGEKITIVYDDWYPYCYTDENGKATGMDVDVSEFILNLNGYYDVDYVRYDWDECINAVKENRVDGILSLLKTKERLHYLQYPSIYLSYAQSRFYALNNGKNYNTLGLVAQYEYTDVVYKNKLKKIKFQTPEELLEAFFDTKEIDLVYEDNLYITEEAKKRGVKIYPITKYSTNTQTLKESKPDLIYIAFTKRFPKQDVDKFSRTLKQFRGTPVHKQMVAKYTDYKLYKNALNSTTFYIPMLVISFMAMFLLLVAYSTIKYNHFNFQSLLFILVGAIIVSMADLFSVLFDLIFYIKLVGMVILSYGIYKVLQKYWNTKITALLYIITTLIGFTASYYFTSISLTYYTVSILAMYVITYNIIKKGINHNVMINSASAFYITFSIIVGLSRQDILPYNNTYAIFFAVGYIFQLVSSFRRNI